MIEVIDGVSGPLSNSQKISFVGPEPVPAAALEAAGAAELGAGAEALDATAAGADELALALGAVLSLALLAVVACLELLHAATPKTIATTPTATARPRSGLRGLPGVVGRSVELIGTSVFHCVITLKGLCHMASLTLSTTLSRHSNLALGTIAGRPSGRVEVVSWKQPRPGNRLRKYRTAVHPYC
ncbi:MAG TPA: hypothetical protein VGL75_19290 [Acidothermaceae bacterium]|jgi:hypothetical protein